MKFQSIQYLRAIAALLVVGHHALSEVAAPIGSPAWDLIARNIGPAGVDIFFVISGFVMWLTTEAAPITPIAFYGKRLVRIVPLYWLLTGLVVGVMIWVPSALQSSRFETWHVAASLLFLPAMHPVLAPSIFPVLMPGWTLNYEMFFYLIFGALLVLRPRSRLILLTAILVAVVALDHHFAAPDTPLSFYGSGFLLEFLAGVFCARAIRGGATLPAPLAALLVLAGLIGAMIELHLLPTDAPQALVFGLPALAIVTGAVLLESAAHLPRLELLSRLGDASYSIYLSQMITIAALRKLLAATDYGHTLWVVPIDLAVVAGMGVLIHRLIERPLLATMTPSRLTAPRCARVPQAAVPAGR